MRRVRDLPDGISVGRCRDDAEAALAGLAGLEASGSDEGERLAVLLAIACQYRFNARVAKDTVNALRSDLDEIAGRATEILASGAADALISATRVFEARLAEEKAALGVVDFEDLQLATRDALRTVPGLSERYRGEFRLVMIDEFQDTNELQTSIVQLLSSGDLCTVGDEHQSIYGFRFADVENFSAYVEDMRGVRRSEGVAVDELPFSSGHHRVRERRRSRHRSCSGTGWSASNTAGTSPRRRTGTGRGAGVSPPSSSTTRA